MERNLSVELRPQSLQEFIGCSAVANPIKEGLAQGRVDSTYLFSGSPGTGKTSMARVIAKLINGPQETYDITEPDTSELSADGVRELMDHARLMPQFGNYRCIILDEVHKLNTAAQTILLKAIEEPCPTTVWFLCTSEPGKLSEAIRRRCAHYIMPTLQPSDIGELVRSSIKQVGGEVDRLYLQTPGKTGKAACYDLIDELINHEVTSPGLILRAVEKFITGVPANEAALVSEVTTVDTFAVARAAAKGDWSAVQKLLQNAPRSAARDIRSAVAGYFRSILLKESAGSQRAARCVWAIQQMADLSNQSTFEEGLIWAAVCASLYNICIGQKEYISKKG